MSSPPAPEPAAPPAPSDRLVRRIRFLVAFTIVYNLVEAAAALAAGVAASSSALLGFGLDSLIEVASAVGVAWQFAGQDHQARERIALRVTSCSFLALAAFVGCDAVTSLIAGRAPSASVAGVVIAVLSLVVMPVASGLQRRAGRRLGSQSAVADSKQTLLCTYMSAALLLGLVANVLLGWWWADPVAALIIAALAVREGYHAWRGEACCSPTQALLEHHCGAGTPTGIGHCCDSRPRAILDGSAVAAHPAASVAASTSTTPRSALEIRAARECACRQARSAC